MTLSRDDRIHHYAAIAYAYQAMICCDRRVPECEVTRGLTLLRGWQQAFGGADQDVLDGWTLASNWRETQPTPVILLPKIGRFLADQPRPARIAFLEDLVFIAMADGVMRKSEGQMLHDLAGYCGFEVDLRASEIESPGALTFLDADGPVRVSVVTEVIERILSREG